MKTSKECSAIEMVAIASGTQANIKPEYRKL